MSLKAKIEAVIYASEEPVTVAQLVGLLGQEAQAELDSTAAGQAELALDTQAPAVEDAVQENVGAKAQAAAEPASTELHAKELDAAATSRTEPDAEESGPDTTSADAPRAAKARERALREFFQRTLATLVADYANGDRGLEIREIAGGFRFATKPEYHDAVRGFVKSLKPPLKLSLQALETLAVVAYKQPVTAPEVSEIRGVDSGGVLGGLMTRKLVTTAGRKQVIGRPILYKTTKDFLVRFGLKDINELPSIEEFEKMAGELVDAEPVQEEFPMPAEASASSEAPAENRSIEATEAAEPSRDEELSADVEPMRDVHSAQADGVPDEQAATEGTED